MKKLVLASAFLIGLWWLSSSPAQAANCNATNGTCFWIGGTGTLDEATDSAHWSNSTGGTTCSCEPVASATLTFDGSSGGGTITINENVAHTGAASFTCGAFTGTIDWTVNNNTFAFPVFNCAGTSARTVKTGTGTWTIGTGSNSSCFNLSTATSLTFTQANTIKIQCSGNFSTGGPTGYNIIELASSASNGITINGAVTIATLNLDSPGYYVFPTATTTTVTNAMTIVGSSGTSAVGLVSGTVGTQATIALGAASTCVWCSFRDIKTTTSSMTATNSFNLGNNSGPSITAPSGGGSSGGGALIGG